MSTERALWVALRQHVTCAAAQARSARLNFREAGAENSGDKQMKDGLEFLQMAIMHLTDLEAITEAGAKEADHA